MEGVGQAAVDWINPVKAERIGWDKLGAWMGDGGEFSVRGAAPRFVSAFEMRCPRFESVR